MALRHFQCHNNLTTKSASSSASNDNDTSPKSTEGISCQFKVVHTNLKSKDPGKYIKTPTFTAGGHRWFIKFYPLGLRKDDNGEYISLYLTLQSQTKYLETIFEFCLLDEDGFALEDTRKRASHNFRWQWDDWGIENFIKRDDPACSDRDSYNIACTVEVVGEKHMSEKSIFDTAPFDMSRLFLNLMENGVFTDVTFEVEGQSFQAHRMILAGRSPVFKAQLFGPMSDQSSCIKISDMHADVFKYFLHFIYTDSIPAFESTMSWSFIAQHLLVAADKYDIPRLKLICEELLVSNMCVEIAPSTLALAELHGFTVTKEACLDFIAMPQNRTELFVNEEYVNLMQSSPSLLAELRAKVYQD